MEHELGLHNRCWEQEQEIKLLKAQLKELQDKSEEKKGRSDQPYFLWKKCPCCCVDNAISYERGETPPTHCENCMPKSGNEG